MAFNISYIQTSSDGAWQGDNPLHYAFPLLIIQTTLVLLISRTVSFFLKPLRQPRVIAEIFGGIMLGPSALGRNKEFLQWVFPSWSTPILESVASMGLLFFLFLVGLELDLSSMRRCGKRAFGIAFAGISLPFLFGIGVTLLLRRAFDGKYILFMGIALSITAFPVLARILAELKLLTTQVGETAMAAAALNDVAAWILLALVVAIAGGAHKSPLIPIWVLICGFAFVIFMLLLARPAMNWVASQCSSGDDMVDEAYICLTLAAVMLSGFVTDLIGIHSIFGGFVFGLTIPKGGEFSGKLIKRIEDFVCGLLLPLYFASSGLKTDFTKIQGLEAWGILVLVISTACAGKILGTFLVATLCTIPFRESLTLGLLMNTKGLVELIVLNIGKEKKILNDEMFAILVIMALFTTFMTTPTVMAIYKPARETSSRIHCRSLQELSYSTKSEDRLRILACVHGPRNWLSLINLIESKRSTTNAKSGTKLYLMHLIELADRPSSIVMARLTRKNGMPCISSFPYGRDAADGGRSPDQVAAAFAAHSQLSRLRVRPMTAISTLRAMHEDISRVAEEKRVAMIILPFHRQWTVGCDEEEESFGHGWSEVSQRVLMSAPCSVAVVVDRGFGIYLQPSAEIMASSDPKRVCVIFIGGPDSREALAFGGRMAEHSTVQVSVIRFTDKASFEGQGGVTMHQASSSSMPQVKICDSSSNALINNDMEMEVDEAAITEFRRKWEGVTEFMEKEASDLMEGVLAIAKSKVYQLIVVGKGRFPPAIGAKLEAEATKHQAEPSGLGTIGDLLASPGIGIFSSVLVIQQHGSANSDTVTGSNIKRPEEDWMNADATSETHV